MTNPTSDALNRGPATGGIANLKPFAKGISGNPRGRTPGSKNRSTIAKEFSSVVTGGTRVNGEICPNMTAEELMIAALFRKAFDGDINAIKEIQDTLYGKLTDKSEVSMDAAISRIERKVVDDNAPDTNT